ncbi:MAG: type II toxin-antitoxin system HigB family toxin [Deltaproteobacteria bacterium]|nr:type II toxin-antitoxin system HigB family toxin [Deltaproteobacteria bacterium]
MRIYSRSTLLRFWAKHPDAEQPLRAWFAEAKKARWKKPADIRVLHRTASFVGDDRVVFNVGGNKYRLVVAVSYRRGSVFVRFLGTHPEYDRIDVEKV